MYGTLAWFITKVSLHTNYNGVATRLENMDWKVGNLKVIGKSPGKCVLFAFGVLPCVMSW